MTIFMTGSSGFVGNSIKQYLKSTFFFTDYIRGEEIRIKENIVLHFAGKAHDLKKNSQSNEYYFANTELTKIIFQKFLDSKAKVFITLSSVKAVADELNCDLIEDYLPNPITHYGKSKLLSEQYILSKTIPEGKRVYILRPCMIHGPGNKGNLNLLYNYVSNGMPWPLGLFENFRSYLSIENLCFIIKELINREDIPSGIYNVADDNPLSTNEVIELLAQAKGKKTKILNINKKFIYTLSQLGNFLKLPFNTERLNKLTQSYVVSNVKIKLALGKPLPISSKVGLLKTFKSFSTNV